MAIIIDTKAEADVYEETAMTMRSVPSLVCIHSFVREEQSQSSRRRHSPRLVLEQFHDSYHSFTVNCCCSEYDLALLCSPRRTVSFAVPTSTPTFLPSALSHLRGYVHCVLV